MIHAIPRIRTGLAVVHANDHLVALPTLALRVFPAKEEEHDVGCDEAAADIKDDDAVSENEARCVSGSVLREMYQRR